MPTARTATDMDDALHRRHLLAGLGALATAGVAGCTGTVDEAFGDDGDPPFDRLPASRETETPENDRQFVAAFSPATLARYADSLPNEEVEQLTSSLRYFLPVEREPSAVDWLAITRGADVSYAMADVDANTLLGGERFERVEEYGGYVLFDRVDAVRSDERGSNVGMVAVGESDLYTVDRGGNDVTGLKLLKRGVDARNGAIPNAIEATPSLGSLTAAFSGAALVSGEAHDPEPIDRDGDYRDEQTPDGTTGPAPRYVGSARAVSLGRSRSVEHVAIALEPGAPVDVDRVKPWLARRFRNGPDGDGVGTTTFPGRFRRDGSLVRAELSLPTAEFTI